MTCPCHDPVVFGCYCAPGIRFTTSKVSWTATISSIADDMREIGRLTALMRAALQADRDSANDLREMARVELRRRNCGKRP